MIRTLYHCMNREPVGDALMPTCEREANGRTERFLFATPYMSKALAFAFDYHEGKEIICNGGIDGTDDEFAIICDRNRTLNAPRVIRLYAFDDPGFEDIPKARQCVYDHPVPLIETRLVLESDNVEDLMLRGLQIFSTPQTLDALCEQNFLEKMHDCPDNESWLVDLVAKEGFVWENLNRDVSPTAKILERLDRQCVFQASRPSGIHL